MLCKYGMTYLKKAFFQTESLNGARFLSLSDYSVVDMMNPNYSGVVMGVIKQKNITMIFRKVSRTRYHQINTKVWDKARVTLHLAQSVDYTILRGKKRQGTH
jgi:hypothetical protein